MCIYYYVKFIWLYIFPDKNLPQELEKAKNMAIEKVK